MSRNCGCDEANEKKFKAHDLPNEEIGVKILRLQHQGHGVEANQKNADENRNWLKQENILALNLIASPGAGKTLLLEKTLDALKNEFSSAVITGDQQTDRDAQRLSEKGSPVCQVNTLSACHLDASQVHQAMHEVVTDKTRILFIENVGNLVCPAAFDLGETHKVALLSATDGEDTPLKYPMLFQGAPVVVINKIDLLPMLDVDLDTMIENIRLINPSAKVITLSAKSGEGMEDWLFFIHEKMGVHAKEEMPI